MLTGTGTWGREEAAAFLYSEQFIIYIVHAMMYDADKIGETRTWA